MKAERDNPTATAGNFNTPLSIMKETTGQNSNKKIENIIAVDLTGVYGALHPPTADHTFFSRTHGIFPKTEAMKQASVNLKGIKL